MIVEYSDIAIQLLMDLIRVPSLSREEKAAGDLLEIFLQRKGVRANRIGNNIWASTSVDNDKPTLLLNSHIDTVRPVEGWSVDPFRPVWEADKLVGLGSNDAGASLVCLLMTFLHFREQDNPWNLVFLASAEEEISGANGVERALKEIPAADLAIVGEPTGMEMAIAEKGLCVVDALARGQGGHAARDEGINAIYLAMKDIQFLKEFRFPGESDLLGPVKVSVTQIEAGTQHNVVPDTCRFVIDIRTNEMYSNQEVVDILQPLVQSTLKARSYRLNSSSLPAEHPAIRRAKELGIRTYGSPTLSDQALMNFASFKMGPGASERSHTAGEYIHRSEIVAGIEGYIGFLNGFKL